MKRDHISNITSIYDEYLDTLYSYAIHLGFDEPTAMDAIHDIFYNLCIKQSIINGITNHKSYLLRSLRNRLLDIKRLEKKTSVIESINNEEAEIFPFQLKVTIEDELIEEEDAQLIKQKVEKILKRLTNRQREIIYLRYIENYSYEEIAEIMQISVAASRNLMNRAITKLKESLNPIASYLIILC